MRDLEDEDDVNHSDSLNIDTEGKEMVASDAGTKTNAITTD